MDNHVKKGFQRLCKRAPLPPTQDLAPLLKMSWEELRFDCLLGGGWTPGSGNNPLCKTDLQNFIPLTTCFPQIQ